MGYNTRRCMGCLTGIVRTIGGRKMAQKIREQFFNPKATTDDYRYKEDPNRNLQSDYKEDAAGNVAETALTDAFTVDDGYTLLINHLDLESDGETNFYLKKTTDGGDTWTYVRQWKLSSKGHLSRDYEKAPFSFEGSGTDVQVRLYYKQSAAARVSGGFNGKYIKT